MPLPEASRATQPPPSGEKAATTKTRVPQLVLGALLVGGVGVVALLSSRHTSKNTDYNPQTHIVAPTATTSSTRNAKHVPKLGATTHGTPESGDTTPLLKKPISKKPLALAAPGTTLKTTTPNDASKPDASEPSLFDSFLKAPSNVPRVASPELGDNSALPALPQRVAPPAAETSSARNSNAATVVFDRAMAAQKAGRNDEALGIYRDLLHQQPALIPARVNLALLLLQMKRPAEALPQLEAARQIDRKNPSLPWQIAQILVQLKRPQEAVEPLRSVVKLAPRDVQARGALAQILTETGQPAAAVQQWKALATMAPQSADAAFQAGTAAASLKRWDEAATWLRRAKLLVDKTDPRDPRPTLQLARVLAQSGQKRDAQALLESGIKRFPQVVEIGALLSEVRADRGDKKGAIEALQTLLPQVSATLQNGKPRAQLFAEIARLQMQNKQPEAAAQSWSNAAQLLPRDADLRAFTADALMRSGEKNAAIAQFRQALQLDDKRDDLRLALARALSESGDWKRADIEYSKLRRANSKAEQNAFLLAEHAPIQEENRDVAGALSTWRKLASLVPKAPQPLLQQARLLRSLQRDDDALRVYKRALALRSNQPDALLGVAQLEQKAGQTARAQLSWRTLIGVRPDYFPAYDALLDNAAKLHETDATAEFLRPFLTRQPENPVAFDALLHAYASEGRAQSGRDFVQSFVKKFPKAIAPQRALTRFDLKAAQSRLRLLQNTASNQNSTSSTRTSEKAPTPQAKRSTLSN